jgi:hypothetical protein
MDRVPGHISHGDEQPAAVQLDDFVEISPDLAFLAAGTYRTAICRPGSSGNRSGRKLR